MKNEIERLKTACEANYKHHLDTKKHVMEFFDGLLECSQTKSQREYLQSIKDNIEEIIDENLNSENYYE